MTRRWPCLRRLLATLLITTLTTACASGRASVSPRAARARQVTSIVPIAVEVRVSSSSLFRDREVRPDWSDTARANLMGAIAKHFGQDPRFALKDWHPGDTEAIQQDLERVRHAIKEIRGTTADNEVACVSGPAVALADAAGTDTVLVVYATDSFMTPGSLAALIPLGIVLLPLALLLAPLALHGQGQSRRVGPETIALCLVDPRTGETIWFHTELLGGNLLDVRDVDRLIQHAYTKFKEFRGQ